MDRSLVVECTVRAGRIAARPARQPAAARVDVPCPKCGGEVVQKRSKKGATFFGCNNYPKCDFTSNQKLIAKPCPKGNSTYLVEVFNKQDGFLHEVCPHNHEALPKRRPKKGAKEEAADPIQCDYDHVTDRKLEISAPIEVPTLQIPDLRQVGPIVEAVA